LLTLVWFTLLPELTSRFNSRLAPMLMKIRITHNFAADEFVLKVRVDDASRLRCLGPLADGPGTDFIRSASEIPNQLGIRYGCAALRLEGVSQRPT